MTIELYAKCNDMCQVVMADEEGITLAEYNGYVPNIITGGNEFSFGNDMVRFEIDLKTGKILNWIIPSEETIAKFIENNPV